jgi:hypothetical protein
VEILLKEILFFVERNTINNIFDYKWREGEHFLQEKC